MSSPDKIGKNGEDTVRQAAEGVRLVGVGAGGWRGTLVRRIAYAALGALIAGLMTATAPAATAQEDQPTTVAGLMGRYRDLSNEAERVNEQLLQVQEELESTRHASKEATQRADSAREAADSARARATQAQADKSRVDTLLSANSDLNAMSAFLTSSSQSDVVAKMQASTMATHLSGTAEQQGRLAIAAAQKAAKDATAAQIEARRTEAALTAGVAQVQRRRDDLGKQITQVQAAIDRLTPEQKAMLQDNGPSAAGVQLPKGNLGAVMQYVLNQLGKPYLWGAVGPGAFDCSGLIKTAYSVAGVSVPRVSIQQATFGQQVARADVRAGDIIAYYSPVHHVAIAIDNKRAIHAPSAGQNVKVASIDAIGPITVIRRVMN